MATHESIRELTGAIASGNTEAFALFYRDWFDLAYGFARRATGRDEAFCLDVVQDAMLRVIRSMQAMDTENDLAKWLYAVVKSCAYDHLRKERRRIARESQDRKRPEVGDELQERLEWLRSELAQLDARTFPLIALRYRFGWTLERIGQALGIKPGAVDGRIRRTASELKKKWAETQDEP